MVEENDKRETHASADQQQNLTDSGGTGAAQTEGPGGGGMSADPVMEAAPEKNTMATAGMWCGIAAIVTLFIPLLQFFAPIVLGILAIIFGVKGRKKSKSGAALAGIITGVIAIVLFIIFVVIIGIGVALLFSDPSLMDEL